MNERAVLRFANTLRPGDAIHVVLITEDSWFNPEHMVYKEMPSVVGYGEIELKKAIYSFMQDFRAKMEKLRECRPATEILDAIWLMSEIVKEQVDKEKVLVIISDMRQTRGNIGLEEIVDDGIMLVSDLKKTGDIPDMSDIKTYVCGVTAAGIKRSHWYDLKKFWVTFFKEANADLKSFYMERNIILE